jgi:hypothetical protein
MESGNAFKLEQNAKFNSLSLNNFPMSLGSSLRAMHFERINVRKSLEAICDPTLQKVKSFHWLIMH